MARSQGLQVLLFPYPAQGHMLPLLDMAHHLSVRGLAVTIVVTHKNLPLLGPLLSHSPNIQPLLLDFPDYPAIPPGVENTMDLPPKRYLGTMIHATAALRDPLLKWARSTTSPPSVIVSDFFLGWTEDLARELGIPRLVFVPCSALAISVMHCLWRDMPKRDDPDDVRHPVSFSALPNSPTFPWYQLSTLYQNYKEGSAMFKFIREGFLANLRSWGFVFNTFDALERPYLAHLRRDLGHPRVWAVGPLSPLNGPTVTERGGRSLVPAEDVMAWLDGCAERSVVYVCFGSQATLSPPQAEAVAAGLERSGSRFVWCMKQSTVLPLEGFEDRVAGRGLVIRGWAPQAAILSHTAFGSFLTHCGWNSVMEGITGGAVLLAWPMGADQYSNARLLEEDIGVAVRICEGRDTVPDPDKLARAVAESLDGTRPERAKAGAIRKKALDAMREGGSSYEDLEALVKELSQLKPTETVQHASE